MAPEGVDFGHLRDPSVDFGHGQRPLLAEGLFDEFGVGVGRFDGRFAAASAAMAVTAAAGSHFGRFLAHWPDEMKLNPWPSIGRNWRSGTFHVFVGRLSIVGQNVVQSEVEQPEQIGRRVAGCGGHGSRGGRAARRRIQRFDVLLTEPLP
jgi:hypothetical protein